MSELGRRVPTDFRHVEKYRLRAALPNVPAKVEDRLPLPYALRAFYDQGQEGACVGFSESFCMSLLNSGRRYDARWLYRQAQYIDEWEGEAYEGTSVRAGFDVLRTLGHRRMRGKKTDPESIGEGIETNRWAVSVDEVRAAIAAGVPAVLGINWYSNFFSPEPVNGEYWIGRSALGYVAGGHAILCYGASDRRQAVRLCNSWGKGWPLVWLPYETLRRLLSEDGEAGVVVDRIEG